MAHTSASFLYLLSRGSSSLIGSPPDATPGLELRFRNELGLDIDCVATRWSMRLELSKQKFVACSTLPLHRRKAYSHHSRFTPICSICETFAESPGIDDAGISRSDGG